MIDIRPYLSAERITELKSRTKDGAIMEVVALAAKSPAVEDAEKLQEAIFEREGIMTTGIGLEIAIPHAKIPSVKEFVVAVGTAKDGLDFDAYDGQPVRIVVLTDSGSMAVAGSESAPAGNGSQTKATSSGTPWVG